MTTLFLLPPVSAALVSQLEQHMPVQALTGSERSFRTIQGTAAWYVRCIRTLQSTGPYRLAGGLLAYEAATQLIGENQQVEYLALFTAPLEDYDLYPIPAQVHLFTTEQTANIGWSTLQMETHIVPGDHDSMLQLPHVESLATAISQSLRFTAQRSSAPRANNAALLTLQTGRAGSAPIFCVPGAGDSVTAFSALGEALGPQVTLHGFQPQGLMDLETPHSSVEAAASCYIEGLVREHPTGAYHLLGHSFGGWIVFEVALKMRALGRSPASITMIDTDAPSQPSLEYSRVDALLELVDLFELQASSPLNLQRASFESLSRDAQLPFLHRRLTQAGLLPGWSDIQDLAAVFRVFSTNIRTSYRPRAVCDQPVNLLWVPAGTEQAPSSAALWREWAPALRLRRVEGNHATLLDPPHVAALAHALQTVMK
jgi:arthrofactin-type cyclic lipopeptide synthetase C